MNKHIETLKHFIGWRRSEEIAPPYPADIGLALDYAIDKLEDGGWIKCSDKMPEALEFVLIYCGELNGVKCGVFYAPSNRFIAGRDKFDSDGVTHWQKLPSIPTK